MTWDDKVELVKHLNNARYKEAVKMMEAEPEWDEQCLMMFANGFSLTEVKLCESIRDRLSKVNAGDLPDFRASLRIAMIQNELGV